MLIGALLSLALPCHMHCLAALYVVNIGKVRSFYTKWKLESILGTCCAGNKPSARSAAAVEEAETHKAAGNEFFKAGSYEDAVKAYSRAIELNPDNPVYYSNRAMAYLQVGP